MYRVKLFLYNVYQQSGSRQNYLFSPELAATGIVSLQIGIRIIVCVWITNVSNGFCMPTIFASNYVSVLAVATKPMDQYFCRVLWVES